MNEVIKSKTVSVRSGESSAQHFARQRHAVITSDLVALVVNLAFLPTYKAKKINFDTGNGKELFVMDTFKRLHTVNFKSL